MLVAAEKTSLTCVCDVAQALDFSSPVTRARTSMKRTHQQQMVRSSKFRGIKTSGLLLLPSSKLLHTKTGSAKTEQGNHPLLIS